VSGRARESSGRYVSTNRSSSSPYISTATRRRVGRPTTNDFVAKDVLILDAGKKKLPTKAEKVELEKNRRVISGFDIDRKWDASNLQLQLSNLLTGELTGISFEIVKNCSGTLVTPNIPVGKEIDAKLLLKSIAPAGCVYIRLLEELQSCSDPFNEQDEIPMDNTIFTPEIDGTDDSLISTVDLSQSTCAGPSTITSAENTQPELPAEVKCPFDIESVINGVKEQDLSNPVEVLRFIQQQIVSGRALDVYSLEEIMEGETNYITVDRDQILESTFSELEYS
jgi:hypothetical protein